MTLHHQSPSAAFPLTQSYYSGPDNPALSELTIGEHFDNIVDKFPQQDAIVVSHQNIRWDYQTYQREINRVAAGLLAIGVEKGDRVGIWSPNNIEWALIQMATAKIGAIMVCLNPAYRPNELAFALNNVQVKFLVMAQQFKSSDYVQMIYGLAPELKQCEQSNVASE